MEELTKDEDDMNVTEPKHPELHAWLEDYLENKSDICEELTLDLHTNYREWLGKKNLKADCSIKEFATRLKNTFPIKVHREYVKKVGPVSRAIIDVSVTKMSLWDTPPAIAHKMRTVKSAGISSYAHRKLFPLSYECPS
jgi:hypothetical protein